MQRFDKVRQGPPKFDKAPQGSTRSNTFPPAPGMQRFGKVRQGSTGPPRFHEAQQVSTRMPWSAKKIRQCSIGFDKSAVVRPRQAIPGHAGHGRPAMADRNRPCQSRASLGQEPALVGDSLSWRLLILASFGQPWEAMAGHAASAVHGFMLQTWRIEAVAIAVLGKPWPPKCCFCQEYAALAGHCWPWPMISRLQPNHFDLILTACRDFWKAYYRCFFIQTVPF